MGRTFQLCIVAILFSSLMLGPLLAQQLAPAQAAPAPPQRDPQAIAILQRAVVAMGGSAPADSTATGTLSIVEGSSYQTGTIEIFTRGLKQTAESVSLPDGRRAVVYSNGDAKETIGAESFNPPLELIVTDQCPDFPLPLLQSALSNRDAALRYIGAESLNGAAVQHVQLWNSFASKPRLQRLAPFSVRDVWLESSSGLPVKLAYSRRAAGGASPAIPLEVFFSNYTNVSGVLYPYEIKKSFNGSAWQTITIQNVSVNTGLTDSQFVVE
jgi:hypothetical protein